jgi:hypothetical protein
MVRPARIVSFRIGRARQKGNMMDDEKLKEILRVGQLLSNAAFQLKQDNRLDEQTRSTLKETQEAWDRAYREWFKIQTKLKER